MRSSIKFKDVPELLIYLVGYNPNGNDQEMHVNVESVYCNKFECKKTFGLELNLKQFTSIKQLFQQYLDEGLVLSIDEIFNLVERERICESCAKKEYGMNL